MTSSSSTQIDREADHDAPLVSVIVPVYNAGQHLREAISSILNQTFGDFELIVIDDGSSDGAPDYLSSEPDPRLRFVRQDNRGLAPTLNYGIQLARGRYVARMDADDIALPDRLARQVEIMEANNDLMMLGSQVFRMVDGEVSSRSHFPTESTKIRKALKRGEHAISHPTVMFRKSAAHAVGGYWSNGVAEDWDFYLKLSELGRVANTEDVLLKYRFHSGGINASAMNTVRTNIALAIENSSRRVSRLPEYTRHQFLDSLTPRRRLRIYSQTRSLTLYRKGLASRSGIWRGYYFLGASLWWPSQAYRRVVSRK